VHSAQRGTIPIDMLWTDERQTERPAILPADHSSLAKIYSSASEGLHTSSWQCQVVGVSALVSARYDRYEDSAMEKRLLQWLELVQVGSLDSAVLVSLT
jgi:hypothetical protein